MKSKRRNRVARGLESSLLNLARQSTDKQFAIGPVVWQPQESGKDWYFILAMHHTQHGFHSVAMHAPDKETAESARAAVFVCLASCRPCVVHDCDDEFYMADLIHVLWPCDETRKLAADAATEHAA